MGQGGGGHDIGEGPEQIGDQEGEVPAVYDPVKVIRFQLVVLANIDVFLTGPEMNIQLALKSCIICVCLFLSSFSLTI